MPPLWDWVKGKAKEESETDWANRFTLKNSVIAKNDILLIIASLNFYS